MIITSITISDLLIIWMMVIHVPGPKLPTQVCLWVRPFAQELGGIQVQYILNILSIYKYVPSGDDGDDDNRSDKAGGKSNSILTQFIKHMNKATLNTVMIAIINTIVMLTQDFANLPVCHKNI